MRPQKLNTTNDTWVFNESCLRITEIKQFAFKIIPNDQFKYHTVPNNQMVFTELNLAISKVIQLHNSMYRYYEAFKPIYDKIGGLTVIEWPEDCLRIQRVLLENKYHVTLDIAQYIWQFRSDTFQASWLTLPEENDDLFEEIREYYINYK